jgi:hypothetical protein
MRTLEKRRVRFVDVAFSNSSHYTGAEIPQRAIVDATIPEGTDNAIPEGTDNVIMLVSVSKSGGRQVDPDREHQLNLLLISNTLSQAMSLGPTQTCMCMPQQFVCLL